VFRTEVEFVQAGLFCDVREKMGAPSTKPPAVIGRWRASWMGRECRPGSFQTDGWERGAMILRDCQPPARRPGRRSRGQRAEPGGSGGESGKAVSFVRRERFVNLQNLIGADVL
jgi:hypothetical protein